MRLHLPPLSSSAACLQHPTPARIVAPLLRRWHVHLLPMCADYGSLRRQVRAGLTEEAALALMVGKTGAPPLLVHDSVDALKKVGALIQAHDTLACGSTGDSPSWRCGGSGCPSNRWLHVHAAARAAHAAAGLLMLLPGLLMLLPGLLMLLPGLLMLLPGLLMLLPGLLMLLPGLLMLLPGLLMLLPGLLMLLPGLLVPSSSQSQPPNIRCTSTIEATAAPPCKQ
jgi:hypothetical protein